MLRRNPAKQWLDRKVIGPPIHWLAWRFFWPERIRDQMLGWYYMHCAEGRTPTRGEMARYRARWDGLNREGQETP